MIFILNSMWWVILQGVVLFLFAFVSKRKHLLATLLSLEGLMLMIFIAVTYLSSMASFYGYILIYLTLVACEGALGLSILVLIVRGYSSDYFSSMHSLRC